MDRFLVWLDGLPWAPLLVVAALLALAPFQPEPHLVQKLRMLRAGDLHRPIDIFDLVWHSAPLALVVVKAIRAGMGAAAPGSGSGA